MPPIMPTDQQTRKNGEKKLTQSEIRKRHTHTRNRGKSEIPTSTKTHRGRGKEQTQRRKENNRINSRETGSSITKEEPNRTYKKPHKIQPEKKHQPKPLSA